MALFEKKQQLSQGGPKEKTPPPPKEKTPPQKEDTSVFRGKPYLTRAQVREELRKDEAYKLLRIPKEKRIKLEQELFPREKYHEFVDLKEVEKVVKNLRKEQFKNPSKKWEIEREINYLKNKFLRK